MHITADRIQERSYFTGLGPVTLSGTGSDSSYLPFSARMADGDAP